MLDWLATNKTWVFSGIGTALALSLLGFLVRLILRRRSTLPGPTQEMRAGDHSRTVQVAGNVGTPTITESAAPPAQAPLPPPSPLDLERKIEALRAVIGDIGPDINTILNVAATASDRQALAEEMRALHKRLEQMRPLFQGNAALQTALTRLGNLDGSAISPCLVFELYRHDLNTIALELDRLTSHAAGVVAELILQRLVPCEDDSPWVLLLVAKNAGAHLVSLHGHALFLPDGAHLDGIRWHNVEEYNLPHDLPPGKRCEAWVKAGPVGRALHEHGLSGTIELRGYYLDALDRRHPTAPLAFDIDRWAAEPEPKPAPLALSAHSIVIANSTPPLLRGQAGRLRAIRRRLLR